MGGVTSVKSSLWTFLPAIIADDSTIAFRQTEPVI